MHESVERAISTGTDFLLAGQGSDGMWRDFRTPAGEGSAWPTAYIASALQLVGADRTALERAANALVSRQQADGGWGYNEQTPTDADSTSWALLFLGSMNGHDSACDRARRCLADHQRRGGGIATYASSGPIRRYMRLGRWVPFRGWCRPNVEVTAIAGRSQSASTPGTDRTSVEAAWRFVRSQQHADGSWHAYWWISPHFATQQAADFALGVPDLDAVDRAAGWARRRQGPDGGWDSTGHGRATAFETALSLSVLAMARRDDQQSITRAIDALVDLRQEDGGWPCHPIMRIPVPADARYAQDDRWRLVRFDGGIVVADQHRMFTTATCVAALSRGLRARCRKADVEIPDALRQAVEDAVNHSLSKELDARGLLLDRETGMLATAAAARSGVTLLRRLVAHSYPDSRLPGRSTAVEFDGDEAAAHVEFALAFGAVTARLLAPSDAPEPVDLLCAVFNLGIGLIDGLCDGAPQVGLPLLDIVRAMNLPDAAQRQWGGGQLRAALPPAFTTDATVSFTARVIEAFFDLLHSAYPGREGSAVRRQVGSQLEAALDAEGRSVDLGASQGSPDELMEFSRRTSVIPFQIIENLANGGQALPRPTAGTLLGEAMWRLDDLVDLVSDARVGALNSLILTSRSITPAASVVAVLEQLMASQAIPAAAADAAQCLNEGLAASRSAGTAGANDRRVFLSFVQRYAKVEASKP